MESVVSVILAGGEGTRLFPLTRGRCKPDVRFGGRYRLIDIPISNSIHSKIQSIFVLTQHFTSSLHQHIFTTYPQNHFHTHQIHLLTPQDLNGKKNLFKGTADAVRQNLDRILQAGTEYVLILAGDQLYHMNYLEMIQFAKKENADLVIAALPVEEHDAKRMGLLKIDRAAHIVDFQEKPTERKVLDSFATSPQKYLGSMGIYVFKRAALEALLKEEGDDFGKHIIPIQVKKANASAFVYNGYWEDIGTISAYYHANLALTKDKNWMSAYSESAPIFTPHQNISTPLIKNTKIVDSLINQGAFIEAAEVIHSIVGIKTHIMENTIVKDTIIIGDPTQDQHSVVIGKNCVIQKAIIDSDVVIGDNVQLINREQLQKLDSEKIYIRDGIIIVTAGARIPDGFIL